MLNSLVVLWNGLIVCNAGLWRFSDSRGPDSSDLDSFLRSGEKERSIDIAHELNRLAVQDKCIHGGAHTVLTRLVTEFQDTMYASGAVYYPRSSLTFRE